MQSKVAQIDAAPKTAAPYEPGDALGLCQGLIQRVAGAA